MKLYKVKGISMYPLLKDNDFVVTRELPMEQFKKGCVVVFTDKQGRLIIHRMVGKKGDSLYLKGDGHNLKSERVDKHNIKGKAIGIIRHGRFIGLSRFGELYSWMASIPRKHFIGIRKKFENGT